MDDTALPRQSALETPSPERRMAETPVPDTLNRKRIGGEIQGNNLKKERFAGLLIYIMSSRELWILELLSSDHRLWIKDFLGKVPEDLLLKSYSFAVKIHSNKRVRNSLRNEIVKELQTFRPRITPSIPTPRRIGVGYRDKGALRPLHQKRNVGAESFWWDDVKHLLPADVPPPENGFITAEEVLSLGINPDHYLLVLQQVSVMASFETLSNFQGN